jgi:hypothetical protein
MQKSVRYNSPCILMELSNKENAMREIAPPRLM